MIPFRNRLKLHQYLHPGSKILSRREKILSRPPAGRPRQKFLSRPRLRKILSRPPAGQPSENNSCHDPGRPARDKDPAGLVAGAAGRDRIFGQKVLSRPRPDFSQCEKPDGRVFWNGPASPDPKHQNGSEPVHIHVTPPPMTIATFYKLFINFYKLL